MLSDNTQGSTVFDGHGTALRTQQLQVGVRAVAQEHLLPGPVGFPRVQAVLPRLRVVVAVSAGVVMRATCGGWSAIVARRGKNP